MKNTIPLPDLVENRSQERDTMELANAVKGALNFRYQAQLRLTTAATGVYTSFGQPWGDMPLNSAWAFDAYVIGRSTAGGAARALYHLEALFYREAAGALQEGATMAIVAIESVAAFDARYNVAGNGIAVQVTDDAVRTMNWGLIIEVAEVR